jgi:hypothetical protein
MAWRIELSTIPRIERPQSEGQLFLLRRSGSPFLEPKHRSVSNDIIAVAISIIVLGAILLGTEFRRSKHPQFAAPQKISVPAAQPRMKPNLVANLALSGVPAPVLMSPPVAALEQHPKVGMEPTQIQAKPVQPPPTIRVAQPVLSVTTKSTRPATATATQPNSPLMLVMPEPQAQSSTVQSRQTQTVSTGSKAKPNSPTVAPTPGTSALGSRVPADLTHKAIGSTNDGGGTESGSNPKVANKVTPAGIPTAAGMASEGSHREVAPASIPRFAGMVSAAGYGKVASAGIPSASSETLPSNMVVAPVSSKVNIFSKPVEQGMSNCGGVTEIPCPQLQVRPKTSSN